MLGKLLVAGASGLLSLTLLGMVPATSQERDEPPPPRKKDHEKKEREKKEHRKKDEVAKKKGERGPEGDLARAYRLLRRLRAEGQASGHSEARIREWTDRAVTYYRDGLRALREGNPQLAHEYGAIAHDLARAVDHARNAALYDRADDDLPAPPDAGPGREGRGGEARKELTKAYDRLREGDRGSDAGEKAQSYREIAGELYRAARRDFDAGRTERAAELARAAEAMSHVAEHLGHAADVRETPSPDRARPRGKADREGQILPPPPEP